MFVDQSDGTQDTPDTFDSPVVSRPNKTENSVCGATENLRPPEGKTDPPAILVVMYSFSAGCENET